LPPFRRFLIAAQPLSLNIDFLLLAFIAAFHFRHTADAIFADIDIAISFRYSFISSIG
jgi:hypothetical protein